ncbi:hypothetical protein SPRG_17309 [Saprolegnia parasitica CBS 223.65]|uniref:Uncharacterized protein n=1 Tax=Saprolegnia parasitica (strain CBS 223.65) TaxID=695850 RepID=A0A067BJQ9_SAPPC|nr:hypothetical protein SPRG_17309 [Saprolegnia parasitica CBS 223.65]KDO16970.1 hypothetical protein SPRG_17309 [Saprolegnia parasitica CBS 223.65]|eukprot:XP_012212324.1 hypothetical protein SPRG_17309 [Saprolegnia parasitica CBS 223.65]
MMLDDLHTATTGLLLFLGLLLLFLSLFHLIFLLFLVCMWKPMMLLLVEKGLATKKKVVALQEKLAADMAGVTTARLEIAAAEAVVSRRLVRSVSAPVLPYELSSCKPVAAVAQNGYLARKAPTKTA